MSRRPYRAEQATKRERELGIKKKEARKANPHLPPSITDAWFERDRVTIEALRQARGIMDPDIAKQVSKAEYKRQRQAHAEALKKRRRG